MRAAVARAPDEGELHYSLGLLMAEEQRLEDAAQALSEAAELLPERARVHYNYGLALQHLGRGRKAESALQTAHKLDRDNPEILRALVILYSQGRRWADAYPYAERLVSLYPNAPEPRRMLEQLETLQKYGIK